MMAHAASSGKRRRTLPEISAGERLARHGLSLPRAILLDLEKNGVYCLPGISVEHQHLANRHVLKGTESGGAVASMGRYCAYLNGNGHPLPWLQPLDSFGGNGRHAIVIAEELIRIEMLRVERTYELLISRHALLHIDTNPRPTLNSTVLFRGHAGRIAHDLWNNSSRHLRGSIAPLFYTSAGEIHQWPDKFTDAIRTISGAVACVRCKHTHIATPPLSVPPGP
jgi:hypothetical protein